MWEVIQNRQVLFGNGKAALIPGLLKQATEKKAFVLAFSEIGGQHVSFCLEK